MKASLAALLACLAALCVPTALALPSAQEVAGQAASQIPDPSLPQLPDVPELPGAVGVSAGAQASADANGVGVHTDPLQVGPQDAAPALSLRPAASDATLAQKVAQAAQETAGAGALTFLLVAYSSGLDGLRALFARPGARLQQAGRFLLRLLPFVPLFSRIEGSKVLENPVRARVHEVVVQDPGLSLEEVRSRAGIAWGTAVHHLRRLEDTGLLVSVTQSARRRYFAANTPASRCRTHVAALAQPTARRVADLVRQRPGLDQTALSAALGLRTPAASKHLGQLAAHGLVLVQRDGRRCLYHPTQALHAAFGVLETPTTPALRVSAPSAPAVAAPA